MRRGKFFEHKIAGTTKGTSQIVFIYFQFSHNLFFLLLCVDIKWADHFVFNSLPIDWSCNINDTIR